MPPALELGTLLISNLCLDPKGKYLLKQHLLGMGSPQIRHEAENLLSDMV